MSELFHIESEQSVIGGLLIDPNAFDKIDFLKESDFYREDHRIIYRHIALMLADRKPVDVVTLAEFMLSAGIAEDQIGLSHLGEMAANTPSATNIRRYAEVVVEKRMLRDLVAVSDSITALAQEESTQPAADRIDAAASMVFALADASANDESEPELVGSILSSVVDDITRRHEAGGEIVGLSTGFDDLDAKTSGLQGGDLVIVAGRPSMGKTAIAINIAEHAAVEQGKSVLVFSMEMGKKQLVERSIASLGRIDMKAIRTGQLTDDDFSRMSFAISKMYQSKLTIDDRPALSIAQMRARARRVARKNGGIDLMVVDYIQLATADVTTRKSGSREQEVSSISRGLKSLAKEFNCPVIALSQLSRKCEERADKRPLMSDLRESGAIEQDADLILMMYRDEYYNRNSPDRGIAEVIIGKQRMGETGVLPLAFVGNHSRFENLGVSDTSAFWSRKDAPRTEEKKTEKTNSRKGFD